MWIQEKTAVGSLLYWTQLDTGPWEDASNLKYSWLCLSYRVDRKKTYPCPVLFTALLLTLLPFSKYLDESSYNYLFWEKKNPLWFTDLYIVNREFMMEEYFLKIQIAQLNFIPSLILFFFMLLRYVCTMWKGGCYGNYSLFFNSRLATLKKILHLFNPWRVLIYPVHRLSFLTVPLIFTALQCALIWTCLTNPQLTSEINFPAKFGSKKNFFKCIYIFFARFFFVYISLKDCTYKQQNKKQISAQILPLSESDIEINK